MPEGNVTSAEAGELGWSGLLGLVGRDGHAVPPSASVFRAHSARPEPNAPAEQLQGARPQEPRSPVRCPEGCRSCPCPLNALPAPLRPARPAGSPLQLESSGVPYSAALASCRAALLGGLGGAGGNGQLQWAPAGMKLNLWLPR